MSEIETSFDLGRSTFASPIMLITKSPKLELMASLECFRYKKNYIKHSSFLSQVGLLGFQAAIIQPQRLKTERQECPDFGVFPFLDIWFLDSHCI